MKLLIEAIVHALVDKPDEVQIKEVIGEHAHVLELPSGMTTQQHIALLGAILFGPDPGVEDDDGELYEEDPEFKLQNLAELVHAAQVRGWVVLGGARNV